MEIAPLHTPLSKYNLQFWTFSEHKFAVFLNRTYQNKWRIEIEPTGSVCYHSWMLSRGICKPHYNYVAKFSHIPIRNTSTYQNGSFFLSVNLPIIITKILPHFKMATFRQHLGTCLATFRQFSFWVNFGAFGNLSVIQTNECPAI